MKTEELTKSTPFTIQTTDNYLKDYVNLAGAKWDTNCLENTFTNLGKNFENYVQKIGDYNTIAASNPQYTPPKSWQEKDYDKPCPEGWTDRGNGNCINPNYTAKEWGTCVAGRTKQFKRNVPCPTVSAPNPYTYYPRVEKVTRSYQKYFLWWSWTEYYDSWETRWYAYNNQNYYGGWNGPTDIGWWSTCTANIDYSKSNGLNTAQADCRNSGNYPSNSTCYMYPQYDSRTESPSNFNGYNSDGKRNWENYCQAYWPMKTITIPGKWKCDYGESIWQNIGRGEIKQLPVAVYNPIDAAKAALKSNEMNDNYYAIINNNLYIIGQNSSVNVILTKGAYQQNCTENNNQKISLFMIKQSFFDTLEKCKMTNKAINNSNVTRDVLQSAITSVREPFFGGSRNSGIIEHLDGAGEAATNEVLDGQNEITKNLIDNYNKKAELYNYQVSLIGQNEKLVEDHNTKLNMQLAELSLIQDQIALKDRIVVLNEELFKKQVRNKKLLFGFFVLIPFLLIPLILVATKAFNLNSGVILAVVLIVGYIIYAVVVANQNDIKKFGKESNNVISKYEKAIANYWNKEKEALRGSLSNFVYGQCANSGLQEEEEGYGSGRRGRGKGGNVAYPKGDYLMKSNGPFYYYDGSAPPQQIYPNAVGSIEFNIEGKNQMFPNNFKLNEIKNPITKFFFMSWVSNLIKNGVNLRDPRFSEVLDVIEYPDSDRTPMPFWDNIKLPIVTNIDQQFNFLFQSYNGEKKNLSQTASVLLGDLWNFIFGDKIPNDIYESWVRRLANIVKQEKPDIEKFYLDYLQYITREPKFTEKYGSDENGWDKFVEFKMIDLIKTFNQDISVSQPFAKKYVP